MAVETTVVVPTSSLEKALDDPALDKVNQILNLTEDDIKVDASKDQKQEGLRRLKNAIKDFRGTIKRLSPFVNIGASATEGTCSKQASFENTSQILKTNLEESNEDISSSEIPGEETSLSGAPTHLEVVDTVRTSPEIKKEKEVIPHESNEVGSNLGTRLTTSEKGKCCTFGPGPLIQPPNVYVGPQTSDPVFEDETAIDFGPVRLKLKVSLFIKPEFANSNRRGRCYLGICEDETLEVAAVVSIIIKVAFEAKAPIEIGEGIVIDVNLKKEFTVRTSTIVTANLSCSGSGDVPPSKDKGLPSTVSPPSGSGTSPKKTITISPDGTIKIEIDPTSPSSAFADQSPDCTVDILVLASGSVRDPGLYGGSVVLDFGIETRGLTGAIDRQTPIVRLPVNERGIITNPTPGVPTFLGKFCAEGACKSGYSLTIGLVATARVDILSGLENRRFLWRHLEKRAKNKGTCNMQRFAFLRPNQRQASRRNDGQPFRQQELYPSCQDIDCGILIPVQHQSTMRTFVPSLR
jgi:hypothetical protein